MKRPHGRELQAMSGAPIKKLPASPSVRLPGVSVADRGGEKINVRFSNFGAGSRNQLRDPRLVCAGNDRKFSFGKMITLNSNCAHSADLKGRRPRRLRPGKALRQRSPEVNNKMFMIWRQMPERRLPRCTKSWARVGIC